MSPQLKADLREFNWIGNVVYSNQLLVVWHTSPTRTIEDAKQRVTTIGTTGAGLSLGAVSGVLQQRAWHQVSRSCSATRAASTSILRWSAARSKAVAPIPILAGWRRSRPGFRRKLIIPLIQAGVEKEPALPDVPLIVDQPVKPQDKPLLSFMAQSSTVGRPLATTPGVPAERVARAAGRLCRDRQGSRVPCRRRAGETWRSGR